MSIWRSEEEEEEEEGGAGAERHRHTRLLLPISVTLYSTRVEQHLQKAAAASLCVTLLLCSCSSLLPLSAVVSRDLSEAKNLSLLCLRSMDFISEFREHDQCRRGEESTK